MSAPAPLGTPGESAVPAPAPDRALRFIAAYKFCKAALLVAIGLGSLRLLNPEVAAWADRWAAALALRHDRRLLELAYELEAAKPFPKIQAAVRA